MGSASHGNCCTDTHDADVCKITHVKAITNNTAMHVPLVVQVSALQEVCASKAEERLVNEAKKWATKAAKDYKITSHGERVRITTERRCILYFTGLAEECLFLTSLLCKGEPNLT